jgi:hypothetical protein
MNRGMRGSRTERRFRRLPQVAIVPGDDSFEILVAGRTVLSIEDELDAHHWAKHVTECVHSGITDPRWIRECLPRLCDTATRNNLHTGYPAAS